VSPSLNHDNKLLDFGPPTFGYDLVDYAYRRTSITLSAQLQGMFFLAETPPGEPPQAFPELTCYRRNLFSITGTITLPRTLRYIVTDQAEQIPILSQELVLCATESIEGNAVKIISVPWKTSAATAAPLPPDDNTEREPPSMPLDITSGTSDADPEYANFPIAFKRLQFRVATANNGRRRELQQHFSLCLRVMATLATGAFIPLCEIASGSIVVRGRSPRNFQAKKDVPLGSGSVGGRRPRAHINGDSTASVPLPTIKTEPSMIFLPEEQQTDVPDFSDWNLPVKQDALTAVALDPYPSYRTQDVYAHSSPELRRTSSFPQQIPEQQPQQERQRPFLAPMNLSLTDEEPRQAVEVAHVIANGGGKGSARKTPRLSLSTSFGAGNSLLDVDLEDAADRLYEYFPLGLDDWQEPVDAVYRYVFSSVLCVTPASKG